MGDVRACVYFSVIFLCFQISIAKPFFGPRLWCDWFCDDDDISTTTTSIEDEYDWCSDCPPRRRRTTTPIPPMPPQFFNPGMQGQPVNLMIPPSNGMNISWVPGPNRVWGMQISPWTPMPGRPVVPAPPAAPGIPAAPAVPGATPAPAAAATPAAVTAAPTTVAAG